MAAEKGTSQYVSQSPAHNEKNARQKVKQDLVFASISAQKARNVKKTLPDSNYTFSPTLVAANSNYTFNPALVAAIIRRKPADIKKIIDPTLRFHDDTYIPPITLQPSQYEALMDFYGKELLANPFKLALKICDSENIETTNNNDATRYDVLHVLAENFDACVADAKQKGHAIPNLAKILKYAESFDNTLPLNTFINGLSDENKARAAKILTPQETFGPTLIPT